MNTLSAYRPSWSAFFGCDLGIYGRRGRLPHWVRFLFSALVDADFLDAEAFFEPAKRRATAGIGSIAALRSTQPGAIDGRAVT